MVVKLASILFFAGVGAFLSAAQPEEQSESPTCFVESNVQFSRSINHRLLKGVSITTRPANPQEAPVETSPLNRKRAGEEEERSSSKRQMLLAPTTSITSSSSVDNLWETLVNPYLKTQITEANSFSHLLATEDELSRKTLTQAFEQDVKFMDKKVYKLGDCEKVYTLLKKQDFFKYRVFAFFWLYGSKLGWAYAKRVNRLLYLVRQLPFKPQKVFPLVQLSLEDKSFMYHSFREFFASASPDKGAEMHAKWVEQVSKVFLLTDLLFYLLNPENIGGPSREKIIRDAEYLLTLGYAPSEEPLLYINSYSPIAGSFLCERLLVLRSMAFESLPASTKLLGRLILQGKPDEALKSVADLLIKSLSE